MRAIRAQKAAEIMGGSVLVGDSNREFSKVGTDTRELAKGSCWVALRGEHFDGNEFAQAALEAGAGVAVVERWEGNLPEGAAVIGVESGLAALQKLAAWHRRQLAIPVVGITGSNGKTSTKDFTTAVLGTSLAVQSTHGNLNNHIGVPLTLLSVEPEHQVAVVEMGMNHAGEIAPLCAMAQPTVGIITNIGTAHIEFLGTREQIAQEKGELAAALPAEGALILPAGCDFVEHFRRRTQARIILVGEEAGEVQAHQITRTAEGMHFELVIGGRAAGAVSLPVVGRHMVQNALLAAGAGWFLGLDPGELVRGLRAAVLTSGRLRRFVRDGVTVFDDTYNANPESMAAAIDTLAATPVMRGGRRFIVMGAMGELGAAAEEAHKEAGRRARARGLEVIAVGRGAAGMAAGAGGAEYFEEAGQAAEEIARRLHAGDVILFKASRSAALENVMNQMFPVEN